MARYFLATKADEGDGTVRYEVEGRGSLASLVINTTDWTYSVDGNPGDRDFYPIVFKIKKATEAEGEFPEVAEFAS